jgi:PAS domain S-box-containing protein
MPPQNSNPRYPVLMPSVWVSADLRALLDAASDALLVAHAPSGQLVDCSDAACLLLGYTRRQLLALTLPVLFQDGAAVAVRRALAAAEVELDLCTSLVATLQTRTGGALPCALTLGVCTVAQRRHLLAVVRPCGETKRG